MSRTDPQLKVRFPGDLKQRLMDAAATSGRSLNSEIVQRLEDSLRAKLGRGTGALSTTAAFPSDGPDLLKLIVELHGALVPKKNRPKKRERPDKFTVPSG